MTANAEGDAEFDGANEAFVDTSLEGDTASVDDEDDGPSSDAKLHVLSAHTLLEKIAAKLAQLQSDQHNLHNKVRRQLLHSKFPILLLFYSSALSRVLCRKYSSPLCKPVLPIQPPVLRLRLRPRLFFKCKRKFSSHFFVCRDLMGSKVSHLIIASFC